MSKPRFQFSTGLSFGFSTRIRPERNTSLQTRGLRLLTSACDVQFTKSGSVFVYVRMEPVDEEGGPASDSHVVTIEPAPETLPSNAAEPQNGLYLCPSSSGAKCEVHDVSEVRRDVSGQGKRSRQENAESSRRGESEVGGGRSSRRRRCRCLRRGDDCEESLEEEADGGTKTRGQSPGGYAREVDPPISLRPGAHSNLEAYR